MHILFYIEPHPIRQSFTSFATTAEKFFAPATASSQHRVSLYGNQQTLAALSASLRPHQLHPTEAEQAIFEQYHADDWDAKGIADWKLLMAGEGAIATDYVNVLEALHARDPFDLLVYWGTNGAVRRFGRQYNIPVIAMELGCTRPPYLDSMVMDPAGVNGDSIYTALNADDLRAIIGNDTRTEFLPLPETLSRRAASIRAKSAGRPIALLPLQLYDDANLLRFSRYNSMLGFVQDVVPTLIGAGYFIVIKDHPAAYTRPSGTRKSREVADYLRQFPQCHWISDYHSAENLSLFAIADAVVTVNSSTGFEASLHGLPVVVMGEACYKLPGIFPTFAELLSGSFDVNAYHARLHDLHAFFFRTVLRSRAAMADPVGFMERLIETARLSTHHAGDTMGFAQAAYTAFASQTEQPMPPAANRAKAGSLKAWVSSHPALLRLVLPLWKKLR